MDFFTELFNPSIPFVRNSILASILSSVLFGVICSVVSVKRIAGLAGAISHAVLGGIGIALFLSVNRIIPDFPPILGAIIFAVITATIIAVVSLKARQREDTVINALWAIGMSIGVIFIALTPEYVDPMSYLFGNILLISTESLVLLGAFDLIVLFLVWRYYPQLEASAFDVEFAKTRGINTDLIFIVLLIITAISVVLLQTFVGTLPSGTSAYFSRNLSDMMVLSVFLSFVFSFSGLFLGWQLNLPAGAMVVIVSGIVFLLISFFRLKWK